ncbi:MAG: 3-keto-5-aminohexanoate cleavage protein [Rhodospirillaceae bacterium]|nr:3-keto-5-aminohexanoate cleavage protein [Rhodospirillaceae bacterium]MBT5239304.1 3-keto-5-aminohexanoate cleavage protein [Rhodospirillaceae bacterium]MBT5566322.1 3-keto-5-aminohexanoate cleavage protein [Rhodospirillaceae bacterium]MBT6088415.1 3-keto-5-aminohexanoate cleavage protein [Rhodospirillaceae bacterium]MBT6959947.1 3-keto-5-aminohexanoate cleavage protein [Rhodospirillaceae bacterium]
MNTNVVLTCALTGAGDTAAKSEHVPVTPEQIADAAIDAAKQGASMVHVHVRDVETGKGGRDPAHFREMVQRVRDSGTDIILNLTVGLGGQIQLGDIDPRIQGADTDLVPAEERFRHIEELKPEICTLDCGSMNFGEDTVVVNRLMDLRWMAARAKELGVKPELEIFDMGQMQHALTLIREGLIEDPPLFQFCLDIASGAPATAEAIMAMRSMLPAGANWAAFGISRAQMPMVAQAMLLGGNCRVGLEDSLYLSKGVLATNGQLVAKAKRIIEELGGQVLNPKDARDKLGLKKQW